MTELYPEEATIAKRSSDGHFLCWRYTQEYLVSYIGSLPSGTNQTDLCYLYY